MSSKYSILVPLLLCNICFNGIIIEAKPNDGQLPNAPNSNANLEKLNDKNLLQILQALDFDDLIYMSATSSKFHQMAEIVFHQKYPNYEIRIIGNNEFRGNKKFHVGRIYEKFIEIGESDFIEDVFKYAGKWFQEVSIQSDKMRNMQKIYEIINKYTSDCLPSLDLRTIKADTFDNFAKPFTALRELHFSVEDEKPTANMQPLNKLFPNLARLGVSLYSALDYNFLDIELTHLEHIRADIGQSNLAKQRIQIESLLHKNPQIISIETWYFPMDYIKEINKMLPGIENITLHELGGLKKTIHFENVKNLRISVSFPTDIEMLRFSNIELLDMEFSGSFAELITFFKNHPNLSKLHLHIFGRSTNGQELVDVVANVPNLVELKMVWAQHISPEFIAQIIESHEHLRWIQFSVNEMDVDFDAATIQQFEDFQREYANEWTITNLRSRFVLEKKN